MIRSLRLTIGTPLTILVDADDVASLRAEDSSGGFGLMPGCADLLTVIEAGVVGWRSAEGSWRWCGRSGGSCGAWAGRCPRRRRWRTRWAATPSHATPARGLLIVVGAAQGFGGAYGNRIAEAALAAPETDDLMVIGDRTAETLEARGAFALWTADMAAHAADVPALASRIADAAFERIAAPGHDRLAILHAAPPAPGEAPAPPARRSLVPFDFGRFPPRDAPPPLTTLPLSVLIAGLVREYVFTELCEGLALGFAAENEARAAAMARAQSNIRRIEDDLGRAWRRARQEGMTEEIVELALHGVASR